MINVCHVKAVHIFDPGYLPEIFRQHHTSFNAMDEWQIYR